MSSFTRRGFLGAFVALLATLALPSLGHDGRFPQQVGLAETRGGLDVRAFGAIGDGIADDTAAIQAAITAGATLQANGVGRALYFPAGQYLVTKSIDLKCTGNEHSGTQNLEMYGDGYAKTRILTKLTEAFPAFDLTDCKNGMVRDIMIDSQSGSLETCQFLLAETAANQINGFTFERIFSDGSVGANSLIANIVGVSADHIKFRNSTIANHRINAGYGIAMTNTNVFSVSSKFYTIFTTMADGTVLSISDTAITAEDAAAVYVDFYSHIVLSGVTYFATTGSNTGVEIIKINVDRNMLISGQLFTENQSSATGTLVFNAIEDGGALTINIMGDLFTDSLGSVFGGDAIYRMIRWIGSTHGEAFYFENAGDIPPRAEITIGASHDDTKIFKNTTNLSTGTVNHLRLNGMSQANLGDILKFYNGLEGSRFNGTTPWKSHAYAVYYPGDDDLTFKGRPASQIDPGSNNLLSNITNGAPQASYFTFATRALPTTTLNNTASIYNQIGKPIATVFASLVNNLTGENTADLRVSLGSDVLFELTGINSTPTDNSILIDLYLIAAFSGNIRSHVKVTEGLTLAVNRFQDLINVDFESDYILLFEQKSGSQANPFTGHALQFLHY